MNACEIEMNTVYLLTAILVGLSTLAAIDDKAVPQVAVRRFSGDIIEFNFNSSIVHYRCYGTFLVNERRCVNNEELINGSLSLEIAL